MSKKVLERLQARFGDAIRETADHRGDETAVVARERVLDVMRFLRDEPDLDMKLPIDLTCVDYLALAPDRPRFDVVYHLYSLTHRHRVRVRCPVPEDDATIASVFPVYPGLRWFEREAWDMFGVRFLGHPDLRRMFMYEEFQGHPLRKDYPKERRQPLLRREGVD